jgi:hypothetical protein
MKQQVRPGWGFHSGRSPRVWGGDIAVSRSKLGPAAGRDLTSPLCGRGRGHPMKMGPLSRPRLHEAPLERPTHLHPRLARLVHDKHAFSVRVSHGKRTPIFLRVCAFGKKKHFLLLVPTARLYFLFHVRRREGFAPRAQSRYVHHRGQSHA